jgi:hypothetical protein
MFYSFLKKKLLALQLRPKLHNHPVSAVRDCLFHIFAANFCVFSIRNLMVRKAVVTWDKFKHDWQQSFMSATESVMK